MRRTFELLYPRLLSDSRQITKDDIDQIVKTSKKKDKYPVAIGHMAAMGYFDDTTEAAGVVTNLKKTEKDKLIGDVDLNEDVETAYKAGKYISWSAGIRRPRVRGEEGVSFGPWEFGHLALLGSTEAAFKDLVELNTKKDFSVNFAANSPEAPGETLFFANSDDYENVFFTVSQIGGQDNVELGASADTDTDTDTDIENNENESDQDTLLKQKQGAKEMEENEALQAENKNLQERIEAMEKKERDARQETFSATVENTVKRMKNLGVATDLVETFSATVNGLSEQFVSGAVPVAIFSNFCDILENCKPKVTPGSEQDLENEESEFALGKQFSGREAVNTIIC